MAQESNIIELEAEVVFSNIFKPYQPKDQNKQPLYSLRVKIAKDDPQFKTLVDTAKRVLNKPKLKAEEIGLDDGDVITTKEGLPVAPGCWQLFISAGHSAPIIVDKMNQRINLDFEPGSGSRILLALKVTPYERTIQRGMSSITINCASYYLVKAVDIDLHPYEGVLTEEDKQYTFTRFREKEAPKQTRRQAPAQAGQTTTQPSQEAAPDSSPWDVPGDLDEPEF